MNTKQIEKVAREIYRPIRIAVAQEMRKQSAARKSIRKTEKGPDRKRRAITSGSQIGARAGSKSLSPDRAMSKGHLAARKSRSFKAKG